MRTEKQYYACIPEIRQSRLNIRLELINLKTPKEGAGLHGEIEESVYDRVWGRYLDSQNAIGLYERVSSLSKSK